MYYSNLSFFYESRVAQHFFLKLTYVKVRRNKLFCFSTFPISLDNTCGCKNHCFTLSFSCNIESFLG